MESTKTTSQTTPASTFDDQTDLGSAIAGHQQNQEGIIDDIAAGRLLNITIVDLNKREIQLKMVQYEMVLELREFLSEHVYTCFFTNYYFEHQGQRLNDYTELAELNLQEDPKIHMKPEKYDEKNARAHIRRVKEILSTPQLLSSTPSTMQGPTATGVTSHLQQQQQQQQQQNTETEQESNGDEKKQELGAQQQYEEKLKKNYEEFMAIVERESKKEIPMPPSAQQQQVQSLIKDLFRTTPSIEKEMNKVQTNIKCIENIYFSQYNPVPPHRRMVGDLFYLVVRTLEGTEHGITCSVNGFYRNDSVEKSHFQPGPSQSRNACYSYTLVGCLYQLSPAFGKNLEKYLNSILATEPYFLTQVPLTSQSHNWIVPDTQTSSKPSSSSSDDSSLLPLYGLDPRGVRDWNEEFQVVKDFPKETFLQRVQRDRAVAKVYNDFLDAAVKGAIGIVGGNLTPLNPNESPRQQVFVYNQIFFSYAVDLTGGVEGESPFRDLTSSENNPSFTQANHDLLGLRALQILDCEGLHVLATAVVNYRGHRVIAQSIIPGILNNNDLASLAEYGSVDEHKTIFASEHFHNIMKKVCGEQLGLKVTKVVDGEGKEVEIAGSVEVKGIRGTDKRCYLVDLQGLTPRDMNYPDQEDHHTCLLRPELLLLFQRTKNIEYATGKMADFNKQLAEEQKKEEQKDVKDMTDKEREELAAKRAEENLKRLKEFERHLKDAPRYSFNTNVFKKGVTFAKSEIESGEVAKDEALVKELAQFLKDQAMQKLVRDLQAIEGVPTDSESLEQAFHAHGINMRYIGQVASLVADKDLHHLKTLLEREAVLRSVKHLFNEQLRESTDTHLSSVLAHLFNLLFAPFPLIDKLEEGEIEYKQQVQGIAKEDKEQVQEGEKKEQQSQQQQQQQQTTKQDKKKQKKAKKQDKTQQQQQVAAAPSDLGEMFLKQGGGADGVQPFDIEGLFIDTSVFKGLLPLEDPAVLKMKPSELYEKIRIVAKQRYGYELPKSQKELRCLQHPSNKLALLRDICLKIGVKIVSYTNKDLVLDNDLTVVLAHKSQTSSTQQNQQSKKRTTQQQQQQKVSEITYDTLPFSGSDFAEIFPVVKHLELQNNDVRQLLASAKQAYKDGAFERAFDLYSQCINALLQITGPMNKEVAACIAKLASIQFKFGDFLQAIELQTKSIILQERVLGRDHPQTAYGYSNLALYHHSCGYFSRAFEHMYRALSILKVSAGENHPDIAALYLNLGLMYQDFEHFQAAIDCFLESLYRNIGLFGEKHLQVVSCYQAIAHAHYQLGDYRKALDFQEKAHKALSQLPDVDEQYIKSSKAQMDHFFRLSVLNEKVKNQEKGQRTIGSNKPAQGTIPSQAEVAKGKQQSSATGEAESSQAAAAAQQQARRGMRAGQFMQGRGIPSAKKGGPGYDFLDLLQYNYIREQQQMMAQKALKEQLEQQQQKPSTEETPATEEKPSASTEEQTKKE